MHGFGDGSAPTCSAPVMPIVQQMVLLPCLLDPSPTVSRTWNAALPSTAPLSYTQTARPTDLFLPPSRSSVSVHSVPKVYTLCHKIQPFITSLSFTMLSLFWFYRSYSISHSDLLKGRDWAMDTSRVCWVALCVVPGTELRSLTLVWPIYQTLSKPGQTGGQRDFVTGP